MSEQPSGWKNPQIFVAVIGAITTIVVTAIGVLPNIISSTRPTPTVAPIVVTATPIPTNTPLFPTNIVMTATPMPTNTPQATLVGVETTKDVPTAITLIADAAQLDTPTPLPVIQIPTTAAAPSINIQNTQPNVRLLYDDVSFTLLNESGSVLSLEGVVFRSGDRKWEARLWGVQLHTSIPASNCMRLRDAAVGQRQPPAQCQNKLYALVEVGMTAFFWRDVTSFEVARNGTVIATCAAADGVGECGIFIGS